MTETETNFSRLKTLIITTIGLPEDVTEDQITEDTNLAQDLKADSLGIVELIMNVEEEFDIDFSQDEEDADAAQQPATVSEILKYIEEKTEK